MTDQITNVQFFPTLEEFRAFQNQYGYSFGQLFRFGTMLNENGEIIYFAEEI